MSLRTKLIMGLVAVGLGISSSEASAKKYSFPVHAFGVTDGIVTISVDDDLLVPSLMDMKLTEQNVQLILPYRGSEEALAAKETILSRTDLSFGSTALYFYLA